VVAGGGCGLVGLWLWMENFLGNSIRALGLPIAIFSFKR
jgi:hypothetical protein